MQENVLHDPEIFATFGAFSVVWWQVESIARLVLDIIAENKPSNSLYIGTDLTFHGFWWVTASKLFGAKITNTSLTSKVLFIVYHNHDQIVSIRILWALTYISIKPEPKFIECKKFGPILRCTVHKKNPEILVLTACYVLFVVMHLHVLFFFRIWLSCGTFTQPFNNVTVAFFTFQLPWLTFLHVPQPSQKDFGE